jgi:phage gp36-like protein
VVVDAEPGSDVVVIEIAGGPSLILNPDTARELLLAQGATPVARGAADADTVGGIPVLPQLQWRGLDDGLATRGTRGIGGALVSAFHVVSDLVKGPAADFTAEKIAQRFDSEVADAVYELDPRVLPKLKEKGRAVAKLPPKSVEGPVLVLLHGTFSSTQGTFQKLWANHPDHVDRLFQFYGNRVYALDHSTLGASPIDNALTLVNALLPGTSLHLVTHSRGGLVAEVLAKVCANGPLDADELEPFEETKDYQAQLKTLKALAKLAKDRNIKVERIVRVACPVRGTLLASNRLDAYLSVFKWSLEVAGIPVAPALVDFLSAVAQRRADPKRMPGLAAQIPDSPLVRWLHAGGNDIPGDLRVVAGDLAGDSVTSWLKTLLSDAFFWTDNDLVVQTRGMYGGPPREAGATFLLDQGGQVSHFNYFANDRSADAVVSALTQPSPKGFQPIGPLSWAGKSSTGTRGGPNAVDRASVGDLPAVILVPDVLASHLKIGKERIWLSRRSTSQFHRLALGSGEKVEPDGLLDTSYGTLSSHLSATHEVIEFAYDWRRPIEDGARDLAKSVAEAFAVREKQKTPVRIVAHGMGGLLVRAMEFTNRKLWDQLLAHAGARILLLGVPNGGSWTPMQVLTGDETFGGLLQGLGAPMQDQKTRQIVADFPGFMQLQAGLEDKSASLAKVKTWTDLRDKDVANVRGRSQWHNQDAQTRIYDWGVPTQDVLDDAVAFRKQLAKQSETGFGKYLGKVLAVMGTARATPDGYDDKGEEFEYFDAVNAGDGYVATKNAMLPGVRAWTVPSEHSALTTNKDAFASYADLLVDGDTKRLAPVTAAGEARSASSSTRERRRPSRQPASVLPARMRDLFSAVAPDASLGSAAGPALAVTVVNGNLKFINQPLMLGHYRSLKLTGTEKVMDDLIGGTMSQMVSLRQYPDVLPSHRIFLNRKVRADNPWQQPRPQAVIVVGLGEEGKLTTNDVSVTVSQGVIAWAQRISEETPNTPAQFELAATLLGSGGAGVSAGQSALAVAQGVREANLRLIQAGLPSVGHLYLIELYLDRASEAWRALQVQMTSSHGEYRISEIITQSPGGLRRPIDSSYRGADYDFVTAVTQRDARGEAGIAFRVDTKRARTEVHAQAMQGRLLRELVLRASNDKNVDTQVGRTLFQLLVPPEVEPFLGGTTSMVLEVDAGSAGIPWELLDSGAGTRNGADARPWAIRSKLLRKLRTDDFRGQVIDADADAHVLVIGEPKCETEMYPRLDAAREEARAVAEAFTQSSTPRASQERVLAADKVKALIADESGGADALTIMNAVLEREWRIVHIAGHGMPPLKVGPVPVKPDDPPQTDGDPRGVVLSNGSFLGPREIRAMRVVPELVFVNCCHLAARNVAQVLATDDNPDQYDRAKFAAGVAESLIKIGVRCVIAAGWAVGDDQAKEFASTFYSRLLNGSRFIDAVADARQAAFQLGGNTWAAYQCYGDPDWTFRWETGDAQAPTVSVLSDPGTPANGAADRSKKRTSPSNYAPEFAAVAAPPALILALETLATGSRYEDRDADGQRGRIRYLEGKFGARWRDFGRVAEAFGHAWQEAGDRPRAIRWYEQAVTAADGTATMSATEQLGNLRAREAESLVNKARARIQSPKRTRGKSDAATLTAARKALKEAITSARSEIDSALGLLEPLATLRPTIERHGLCGSAWKRRAMIEQVAGDPKAEDHAIAQMKVWYALAEDVARERGAPNLFYPALNRMAAELIVDAKKTTWKGFEAKALKAVRKNLETTTRTDPDFWSVVGLTELHLYEALADRDLAGHLADIQREYDDHYAHVSAVGYWDSVYTQLEFVLPKYVERARKVEQDAAAALMKHVRVLVAQARRSTNPPA